MKKVIIKFAWCMHRIESLFVPHMEIKSFFYFGFICIFEMSIKNQNK